MKKLPIQGRTLALLAIIIPLLALFIYVGLRSGPLAPVAVTVASVESGSITPALFGIGTVESRYTRGRLRKRKIKHAKPVAAAVAA